MRILAAFFCAAAALAAAAQQPLAAWDAALHLHDEATSARFQARCLDGSRAGFYYRPGNPAKWKFHFQGGGWCVSPSDCRGRSRSLLGSSASWPPALSSLWGNNAGFYGLMDSNSTNFVGDWSFVWFAYCDGSSQTSDAAAPLSNGVHMRGRAILDAHLFELERLYGFMSNATEVLVSGTSAGGLSTYLQSSFIKSQLRAPGARLVAVPDAG